MVSAERRIVEALQPVVEASGLEIWDIERSGNSVRVLVDRPGGVDLDSLARLSGAISELFDQRDDLVPSSHYELDVSSPGVERRLRYPHHFARCLGQEIAVKTALPVDGERRFQGVLVSATDEDIFIKSDGTGAGGSQTVDVRIPLSCIERAHTVFRWGPAQTHTKSKRSTKRPAPVVTTPVPAYAERAQASKEAG